MNAGAIGSIVPQRVAHNIVCTYIHNPAASLVKRLVNTKTAHPCEDCRNGFHIATWTVGALSWLLASTRIRRNSEGDHKLTEKFNDVDVQRIRLAGSVVGRLQFAIDNDDVFVESWPA